MAEAKENGATYMINYKTETDLVGKVKEITGGEGVAVVFDSTGKDQFDNDFEVLARKGSLVSFGNSVSHCSTSFLLYVITANHCIVRSCSTLHNLPPSSEKSQAPPSYVGQLHSHPRRVREVHR